MNTTDIDDLVHTIIGCGVEVHKALGSGFDKEIYKACLAREFTLQDIEFVQNQDIDIVYKDQVVGERSVDFVVEDIIMLEIMTIDKLTDAHRIQAIHSCEVFEIANGLLMNFGAGTLDCKRVYNKKMM
ncbi:MAG: GxxExxY protein [Ignavibacteriae bacterium]|nr:GxxExxY protein [Ignavibacteriota bacterium]